MVQFCFTELPFFDGFYESPYENGDTEYLEITENSEYYLEQYGSDNPDDFELDETAYHDAVTKHFCRCFLEACPEFVENVLMFRVVSPKYYNYSTDQIDAIVQFKDNWREEFQKYLADDKEWLTTRIKDDWSDRDGFWSFLPNSYDEWVAEFQKSDDDIDTRIINELLAYMMFRKSGYTRVDDFKWSNFIYPILEDIYIGEYIKYVGK